MAVAVMVAADGYLRPGEMLDIKKGDVVPGMLKMGISYAAVSLILAPMERGIASKTHRFDDSLIFDSVGREWVGTVLLRVARLSVPPSTVFNMSSAAWNTLFKKAAGVAGLVELNPCPYLLRHSGPSHDYLTKSRDLVDIKRRGRWLSEASVRRYEKSSRVMRQLQGLDVKTLDFLQNSEKKIKDVLLRGFAPLMPPF
jgi:hypothetical protein